MWPSAVSSAKADQRRGVRVLRLVPVYAPGTLCDEVENLLLFVTYWISAWLGVVVVDWVRCRGRVCVTELRDFGRLRWRARR